MTFTENEFATIFIAFVIALYAITQAPKNLKTWPWRRRVPNPRIGDRWANKWGFSFTMSGYSSVGHYVLQQENSKSRSISPELWPEFVQDMGLVLTDNPEKVEV